MPIGDGRIFFTGGYGQGCVMLKVERPGRPGTKSPTLGEQEHGLQVRPGAALERLHLRQQLRRGRRAAVHHAGRPDQVGLQGSGQFDLGCLIIADGLIYIIHGGNGDMYMAEASPDGYKQLGRAPLLARPEPWAPLAFKDGKLVIRDMHRIICLDVTAAGNGAADAGKRRRGDLGRARSPGTGFKTSRNSVEGRLQSVAAAYERRSNAAGTRAQLWSVAVGHHYSLLFCMFLPTKIMAR